jgi:hypothetical protein
MRFNLVLADQPTDRLQEFEDFVRPLLFGLRAAGHPVAASSRGCKPAPDINLAVDALLDGATVESMRNPPPGAKLVFGVLCTTALQTLAGDRRDFVHAALGFSDFIWAVEGLAVPPDLGEPAKVAPLAYGFDERLLGTRLIADPALRDIDVVIYGPECARTNALAMQVERLGLSQFSARPGALPDYLASDLLSRGKVAIVVGDGSAGPSLVPRVLKAICNGATVVTEGGLAGSDRFGDGVVELPDDEMPGRCAAMIRDGGYVERGQRGLARLRAGISMGDAVGAAMRHPAFRLAGGA